MCVARADGPERHVSPSVALAVGRPQQSIIMQARARDFLAASASALASERFSSEHTSEAEKAWEASLPSFSRLAVQLSGSPARPAASRQASAESPRQAFCAFVWAAGTFLGITSPLVCSKAR